jgi:RNA polymerase sigma-70 factor (ECF subfamily)
VRDRVTGSERAGRKAAPSLDEAQRVWLANLYEANFVTVFSACRRVLHDPEEAADAAHEVFLRAVDSLPDRPAAAAARPWLITVARNHCLDLLRRRKRLGRAVLLLGASAHPEMDVERAVVDRRVVEEVLQQLGLRERQALWQSSVERRPVADIAGYLGVSYMAAAQLLHRARRRAVLVAAKLAAIFGVFQLGRAARRASLAGARLGSLERQAPAGSIASGGSLIAAAVVPLVLAALVVSSSSEPSKPRTALPSAPAGLASAARNASVPAGKAVSLPSVPLPSVGTSTANSSITAVIRAVTQLTGRPLPPVSLSPSVPPLPLPVATPKP